MLGEGLMFRTSKRAILFPALTFSRRYLTIRTVRVLVLNSIIYIFSKIEDFLAYQYQSDNVSMGRLRFIFFEN